MALRDRKTITFVIAASFIIFGADARSWDLAVTIGKDVQFFARNGTRTGHVGNRDAVDLGGLAYDDSSRLMFLSDTRNTNLTIFTKNLATNKDFETQTLHRRQNRTSIIGMVYDKTTQNLFWTDAKEQAIMRLRVSSNENATHEPVTVLKLPDKLPRGIALDSCNRRLYWANSNASHPSIESSNLDGSDATIVISKNLYEPLGITVDHGTGKLYWIDDDEGVHYKIERSNLDGSDRELLVNGRHQQPYDIAVDREKIYWTDWTYRAVWSINKNPHPSDLPILWTSFHTFNRDSDPKCIVTRDTIGTINCPARPTHKEINVAAGILDFAEQENDNLMTSTEEGDSIKVPTFECLNDGLHEPALDRCHCKPGFDGLYCERSVCHNYCLHGECFISPGGQPRCKCGPSYQGPRCERNVCTGYCLNDGYCSVKNGEPYCICKRSRGPRCEDVHDVEEICSIFCLSGLTSLNTVDTSLCRCANETRTSGRTYVDDLWCNTVVLVLSALLGVLTISVVVLSYYVHKFKRQRRVRKHIVVNKISTPLTARPQLSGDQCEITIENCCNMNICETSNFLYGSLTNSYFPILNSHKPASPRHVIIVSHHDPVSGSCEGATAGLSSATVDGGQYKAFVACPCFEPQLRNPGSSNRKKEEKNSLLDNMDGNSC